MLRNSRNGFAESVGTVRDRLQVTQRERERGGDARGHHAAHPGRAAAPARAHARAHPPRRARRAARRPAHRPRPRPRPQAARQRQAARATARTRVVGAPSPSPLVPLVRCKFITWECLSVRFNTM